MSIIASESNSLFMKRRSRVSLILLFLAVCLFQGCRRNSSDAVVSPSESKEAKRLLQGIWIDTETDEVVFRVKGDTIFYPDTTSMPAYFKIVNDSLVIDHITYAIEKQAPHLFWFVNQAGDLVKLEKSDNPNDALAFRHEPPKALTMVSELQKTDSVVIYGGERYHWYIAINPTRYRVTKTTYTDDGVGVENEYYDNIIHVSLFKGAQKLFSRDIKKKMYAAYVPAEFLEQAILGNMQYDSIDQMGMHFNATLCIPDGAACYMISTDISFDGQMSMKLLEY